MTIFSLIFILITKRLTSVIPSAGKQSRERPAGRKQAEVPWRRISSRKRRWAGREPCDGAHSRGSSEAKGMDPVWGTCQSLQEAPAKRVWRMSPENREGQRAGEKPCHAVAPWGPSNYTSAPNCVAVVRNDSVAAFSTPQPPAFPINMDIKQ